MSVMSVSRSMLQSALVRLTSYPFRIGKDVPRNLDSSTMGCFESLREMLKNKAKLWQIRGISEMSWSDLEYIQLPAGEIRVPPESKFGYPYLVVKQSHTKIVGAPPTQEEKWPTKILGAISCQSVSGFCLKGVSLTNVNIYGVGLYLHHSLNFVIEDVEISGCSGSGISVHGSTGVLKRCNVHHNSQHGLFTVAGSEVSILSTDLSYNKGCGLLCFSSVSMNCAGSAINGNSGCGLHANGKGTKISIVGGRKDNLFHSNPAENNRMEHENTKNIRTTDGARILDGSAEGYY